ncbi:hypothetical protein D020_3697 [Vibrio parahaemolyticus SBR10290]|nr:hypothetical protein D021_4106 [Vibrio parahaemolyticus 10296]ESW42611.1 hypothetical protein D022_3794 [Vibrio parahaemolyticus 12310]ETX51918.1 hypothetical protein D020_3697 [Vibrio parahaemolyticus SBR10290]
MEMSKALMCSKCFPLIKSEGNWSDTPVVFSGQFLFLIPDKN